MITPLMFISQGLEISFKSISSVRLQIIEHLSHPTELIIPFGMSNFEMPPNSYHLSITPNMPILSLHTLPEPLA